MSQKKHFLLVWPTIRKDWVKVFQDLRNDFQFTFLPSTFPKEPNYALDFDCCYWSEFSSAQKLLGEIKPEGIIFMSIDSGLNMVLNHVAQKNGINTYILQHGIYTNYRDYRTRERLWRKKEVASLFKQEQSDRAFNSLSFIRNSLNSAGQFKLLSIAIYTRLQQKIGPYWAAKNFPLRLKRASYYLCFSPYNAIIHKETDRIVENQISYIGSPELIPYLHVEKDLIEEDFYLHIDQALSENSFGEETVPKGIMIDFYLMLNEFCLHKKSKLYVKLHPESYHSEWLPKHENIIYLRQVGDFNQVIQSAKGCFGFYSTMIIPAVYWKPTILFRIQYSGLQEAISQIDGVTVLDFWSFTLEEIRFRGNQVEKEVVKRQFIQPDGIDAHTLKKVLIG